MVDLTSEGTLVRAWLARWRSDPDRELLHDPRRGWITASELESWSRQIAVELHRGGVGRGCRVVLTGATRIELVVAHTQKD